MFTSSSQAIPSAGDVAWKEPCRLATTAALPANTYASGPPGRLTANANGALGFIDNFTANVGDRVLVKNEANQAHNGIYVVTSAGSAGSKWVLTRAADADEAAELPPGSVVFINQGDAASKLYFALQSDVIADIDISLQIWSPFASAVAIFRWVYTLDDTWFVPPAPSFYGAMVRVVGGGAGGGGAVATGAGQGSIGGGGGGGGYAESWLSVNALTANQAVTVGAGGAAAAGAAGGPGGASSFGALVAANGGNGGGVSAAAGGTLAVGGGPGGSGTAGDVQAQGSDGAFVWIVAGATISQGGGGGSVLGGTVGGAVGSSDGLPGHQYGGGGSGASNGAAQAARPGGAGAAGVVIVDEYYSA